MRKPVFIVQRRLAAIFSADVAGYTRLMNADEVGTLRLLASFAQVFSRREFVAIGLFGFRDEFGKF